MGQQCTAHEVEKMLNEFALQQKESLPIIDTIYERAKHYTDIECNLQNFEDEDAIINAQIRYVDGYIQAIKDYINPEYNPGQ